MFPRICLTPRRGPKSKTRGAVPRVSEPEKARAIPRRCIENAPHVPDLQERCSYRETHVMADGIHPGPKGLRGRILALWRRAVRNAAEPPSSPLRKPRKPPVPTPHPRGTARWKAPALPVQPVISGAAQSAERRRSYFETLKERVREGGADSASLVRRDFDRGRE